MAIGLCAAADTSGRFRPEEDWQRGRGGSAGLLERDRDGRVLRDTLCQEDRAAAAPAVEEAGRLGRVPRRSPRLRRSSSSARRPVRRRGSRPGRVRLTISDPLAPISGVAVAFSLRSWSSADLVLRSRSSEFESEFAQRPRPIARAAAAAATPPTAAERPVPPRQLDDRRARFGTRALDDAVAQLLRRHRPLGGVREGRDRLTEQSELLGALRAVLEVPLEALALVVIERVERVRGKEIVGVLAHRASGYSPGGPIRFG